MRRDLLTLVCLIALLAWLAGQSRAPVRQQTQTPRPTVQLLDPVPEKHAPNCRNHQSARVETLRPRDPAQRAEIDRGEVVYISGSGCCRGSEFSPDEMAQKAIWVDGVFGPAPVAGNSWYCKNCRCFWGEETAFPDLLDHP